MMHLSIDKLYCTCGAPITRSIKRAGTLYIARYFDYLDAGDDQTPIKLCVECGANLAELDAGQRLTKTLGIPEHP